MARPKTDHDQRRTEIARAACDVILELGLENARLSEIAMRAGVTTGAVQHYFRSKEHLLLYAKNDLFDQLYERIRAASAELKGVERLLAIAYVILPTNLEAIKAFRVLEAFRGRAIGNNSLLRIQHKRDRNSIAMIEAEISGLARDGLLADDVNPAREALAFSALLDGLGATVIAAPKAFSAADLTAIVERFIERALGVALPSKNTDG
ncbi:MAG: TetR family transcriptional regulator C-terminal domain-containing protein [Acidobacteria bacterium]|nr:TetR family transcriptional regulator C-terminal domain-containing protein [Acidobacteriota bacterium]